MIELQEFDATRKYCRALLDDNPADANAHSILWEVCDEQEDWKGALEAAKNSVRDVGNDDERAQFLIRAGQASVRMAHYEAAVDYLQRSIEIDPDQEEAARFLKRIEELLERSK